MLKTLFKKQFLELNAYYFRNSKTGKMRSKTGVIGMFVFFSLVFIGLASMFFGLSVMLAGVMVNVGLGHIYFALLGMLTVLFGAFGSIATTYTGLYKSKDNDLLLSMPIKPSYILLTRMTGVFSMSLLYCALVWIPACAAYYIHTAVSARVVIFDVLMLLLIAVFVTVLACALGYVVALIASRVRNKSFARVLFTLLFLGIYYFFYFRFQTMFKELSAHLNEISDFVSKHLFLFDRLGRAACGETVPLLIFAGISIALGAVCVYLLSRSFIRIVTTNRGEKKKAYTAKAVKAGSVSSALLGKEFARFRSSAVYMLNCGLGLLLLPAATIVLLIRVSAFSELIALAEETVPGLLALIIAVFICLILSMNCTTAPSVSIEGNTVWILRSLPVDTKKVLSAKLRMYMILNLPVCFICSLILGIVFKLDVLTLLFTLTLEASFAWVMALFGLYMNLVKPLMSWTNETVPVKQSLAVLLSVLGGWLLAAAVGGLRFALSTIPMPLYLAAFSLLFTLAALFLRRIVMTRGVRLFEEL